MACKLERANQLESSVVDLNRFKRAQELNSLAAKLGHDDTSVAKMYDTLTYFGLKAENKRRGSQIEKCSKSSE